MYDAIPILLLIPLLIGLFLLSSPVVLLATVLLLIFFDLQKIKELYTILFTASLCFLGLLTQMSCRFLSQLFTCSLTLAVFVLIKFIFFMHTEHE